MNKMNQNNENTKSENVNRMPDEDLSGISLPESWAGWHLTGVLGRGAYGTVYLAENEDGRVSAIKVIRLPQDAKVPEIELLPLLQDIPGIVRVEDYCIRKQEGQSEGMLRMEYLTDLTKWSKSHNVTEEEVVDWMIELCDALSACEEQGIVHRDIKPGNILINKESVPMLSDFGVARITDSMDSSLSLEGTFRYMAPEVYHGKKYDHRADIYSLGMVFYELMNQGRIPFEEKGREKALKLRMGGEAFPGPAQASAGLSDILAGTLKCNPDERYGNALELKKDLTALKKGTYRIRRSPVKKLSRRKLLIASAAALIIAIAIAAGIRMNRPIVPRESCGYGVSWVLKKNGTLEVSGKGVMETYFRDDNMDKKHKDILSHEKDIKKLVIKGDVSVVDFAYMQLPSLEEIVISDGVSLITDNSFSCKQNLKSVVFQGKKTVLGRNMFSDNPNLSKVKLPSELTVIPDGCFAGCKSLSDLDIPETVTEIGSFAFLNTPWFEENYRSKDHMIVGDKVLLFWKGKEEELKFTKEMGISHIAAYAFAGSHLKKISMDDSILSIGIGAFEGLPLEEADLPDHLRMLPDSIFATCRNLEKVDLPDSLESIGRYAFRECNTLKEMNIPSGLESIGWQAFENAGPFVKAHTDKDGFTVVGNVLIDYHGREKNLVIPDSSGIKRISEYFLEQNQKIESLTLPEGLEVLGQNCFFMCRNLKTISFPKTLREIGRGSFIETAWWKIEERKDYIMVNNIIMRCTSNDKVIVIPDNLGVKRIEAEAFPSFTLEELTLPPGIDYIDENAFHTCMNLKKVHLPQSWTEEEIRKCFYKNPWYYLRK